MKLKSPLICSKHCSEHLFRNIDSLDIGAISVPARQMNGDYHHFVKDENHCIGIAIADVIGKGIPAALSMSMIKYSMDSLPDNRNNPGNILESLNRVVEQNVEPSMFITMCYGVYNPWDHTFCYATAGHEPGFYYHAESQSYQDLDGKGLLLGIDKKTKYQEYEQAVDARRHDYSIIRWSNGKSYEEGFMEREKLIEYIKNIFICLHRKSSQMFIRIWRDFRIMSCGMISP